MSILTHYREKLHLKEAERGILQQNQQVKNSSFAGLGRILILFEATDEKVTKEILNYVQLLNSKAGTIKLLGFVNTKESNDALPFDNFGKKDLDWIWRPKKEISNAFKKEKFDLLINMTQTDCFPLEFLAVAIEANYKIGALTDYPNNYDLMVEAENLDKYLEQVNFFIGKLTDAT